MVPFSIILKKGLNDPIAQISKGRPIFDVEYLRNCIQDRDIITTECYLKLTHTHLFIGVGLLSKVSNDLE